MGTAIGAIAGETGEGAAIGAVTGALRGRRMGQQLRIVISLLYPDAPGR